MVGQNAAIVFDDADPTHTGSDHCKCGDALRGPEMHRHQRAIVVGSDSGFTEAFIDAVRGMQLAAPDAPHTTLGPVISDSARAQVLDAIEIGCSAGAPVLAGDQGRGRDGWFVQPTVVDGWALSSA